MKRLLLNLLRDEDGQGMVEFLLMVVLAVTAMVIIDRAFRRQDGMVGKMWRGIATDIIKPCPHCG